MLYIVFSDFIFIYTTHHIIMCSIVIINFWCFIVLYNFAVEANKRLSIYLSISQCSIITNTLAKQARKEFFVSLEPPRICIYKTDTYFRSNTLNRLLVTFLLLVFIAKWESYTTREKYRIKLHNGAFVWQTTSAWNYPRVEFIQRYCAHLESD